MGLDAAVIAIGPFGSEVVDHLEYGADSYACAREGARIVTTVFTAETTDASERLARAFGVGAWDLGRHHLDPAGADVDGLTEISSEREVADFLALRAAGFEFFYQPHG